MTSHVYALVENETIVNIVVATASFAADLPDAVRIDHLSPTPGIGWTYRHRRFAPPAPRLDPFAPGFGSEQVDAHST